MDWVEIKEWLLEITDDEDKDDKTALTRPRMTRPPAELWIKCDCRGKLKRSKRTRQERKREIKRW